MQAHGVGVVTYSPLARGILTGKYQAGKEPPVGSRAARNDADEAGWNGARRVWRRRKR